MEVLKFDEAGARTLYEQRLERCVPVAKKVLAILNSHLGEIKLGESDEVGESMSLSAQEVLALFLKENIHWSDKSFILNLALQPGVKLNEMLDISFGISWDKAIGKSFGKDSLDLTFEDVDKLLKS